MKNIFLVLLIFSFSNCQSQVDYNRECENAPPINRNEKWGTLYWNQEIRIPFIYDKLEGQSKAGAYIAYLDGKAGIIDCDGQEIIPFEYAIMKNWLQPFGDQHGLYVVTKKEQTVFGTGKNKQEVLNDWGVINEDNKLIVPLAYGYIRVIDSNLIVARKDRDTILHFFSRDGKLLYEEIGKLVTQGFDENTIRINHFRGKQDKIIYKSGKEIEPEEYSNCHWTDNEHYILSKNDNQILVNRAGKQLSPDGFTSLTHIKEDDFFFSYANSKTREMGVFRINDGIILEPKHFLSRWGDTYSAHNESGENFELLDKNGNQILPMKKYWTSHAHNKIDLRFKDGYTSNFDNFYMIIEDQGVRLRGLINTEGEVVLPLNYLTIEYAWKDFPIIASTKEGFMVFDPDGNQLHPNFFTILNFTADPNVLIIGQNDEELNTQFGLLQLDKPDDIEYGYKALNYISTYCLAAKTEGSSTYKLITPDGSSIGDGHFTSILRPVYPFFERFGRTPHTKGTLIAVGVRNQEEFGINENGEEFKLVQ